MVNTSKILWLLAVLSVVFLILEIGTTESKSLNQESVRLDSHSSGDNSIPEYLKDGEDDFNNESDKGSGDVFVKEKPKATAQASVFTDKQVNKLIQAQDLGKGESEGSAENAIPELKEANDGSGEVIEMENGKEKENHDSPQNLIEDFEKPASTIQSNQVSNMEGEPTIITGGQDAAAVQPAAQVFNDASSAPSTQTQTYNYATAPSTDQTQQGASQPAAQAYAPQASSSEQFYSASSQAPPANQYYNDASTQTTQGAQPAPQTSSDASAQATSAAAQYYNDAASQPATAAQDVQAYASQPQNDAEAVPQPVDVAMTANKPETPNYYPTGPAAQSSQVLNDANGVPQSVDAATMAAPPQQQAQYYNSPAEQTAPQQTSANDLMSSFMANSNGASQQWDNTGAAAQQPMQYTGNEAQNTQAYANQASNTQAPQDQLNGVQVRKLDILDENKFRTLVCQNNQDTIMCPQGKKINITDAHYGSMGVSSCQGPQTGNFLPIQPCETPDAYKVVKTNCDDMENCMLSANDGIFGDQCQSDKKYLDVTYSCEDNKDAAQSQQYMYPTPQPAYAPYQASPYGYPQQQQEQQLNDQQPKIDLPPPPKIPELMSTLVQLSKNKQKYGYLGDQQSSCSSCNKCSQCYKSSPCGQCGFCQSKLCDEAAASLPMIPKNLRPLWEQWNEKTADMNSMEMSALIFESPKKWLKMLHGAKTATGGSKRSHIKTHNTKTHKHTAKKQS